MCPFSWNRADQFDWCVICSEINGVWFNLNAFRPQEQGVYVLVLLVRAPGLNLWVHHAKLILGTSSGEVEEKPGVTGATGVSGWATSTLGERRDIIIKRLEGKGYPDMTKSRSSPSNQMSLERADY